MVNNRVIRGRMRRNPSYGLTQTVSITAETEVRKPRQYWPISCPYHSRIFGSVEAALDAHHDSFKRYIRRNETEEQMTMARYIRDAQLTLSPSSVSHSFRSVRYPTVGDHNRIPQITENSNLAVLQRRELEMNDKYFRDAQLSLCVPSSSCSNFPPRTKNAGEKCGLDVDSQDARDDYTQELIDQMGKSLKISNDDEDDADEDGTENELDLCLKI